MNLFGSLADKHPFFKFIIFGLLLLTSSVLFSFIAVLLSSMIFGVDILSISNILSSSSNNPGALNAMKLIQVINAVGIFFVPAILYSLILGQNPKNFLMLNFKFNTILIILTAALVWISSPFIEWVLTFNQSVTLPDWLSSFEQWMKDKEEQAKKITMLFLQMNSVIDFLLALIIVAVIPAIGEEILFRGILLKVFHEWSKISESFL